jgi:urease accessory protein
MRRSLKARMTTATTIAMTTVTPTRIEVAGGLPAASLLQLIWLASPALPIGGFSYSEGLESAVDSGRVTNEQSAGDWLVDQLHLSLARGDMAVAAQAITAWRQDNQPRIAELNDWVLHTRETSELRQQSQQMGRSLVEWLKSVHPEVAARVAPLQGGITYPVAFALTVSTSQALPRDCLLAFAFGWAENVMQAAIKAVPLGQSAGQRILLRLAGEIPAGVDHALQLRDEDRQAFSPMLAILSARHEDQYSRLFRS